MQTLASFCTKPNFLFASLTTPVITSNTQRQIQIRGLRNGARQQPNPRRDLGRFRVGKFVEPGPEGVRGRRGSPDAHKPLRATQLTFSRRNTTASTPKEAPLKIFWILRKCTAFPPIFHHAPCLPFVSRPAAGGAAKAETEQPLRGSPRRQRSDETQTENRNETSQEAKRTQVDQTTLHFLPHQFRAVNALYSMQSPDASRVCQSWAIIKAWHETFPFPCSCLKPPVQP